MRPRKLRRLILATAAGIVLSGSGIGYAAQAQALPPNCEDIPWGIFGSQRRQICDTPIRPDGSWTRFRTIGVPAHIARPSSSCYGGLYYSNCTYDPGGFVPQVTIEDTSYVVFPDNVVFGEPGHLG